MAGPSPRAGAAPLGRVLSNGRYGVLLSAGGGGTSWFESYQLTRWAGDRVEDADGVGVHLREPAAGRWWSLGPGVAAAGVADRLADPQPGVFGITHAAQGLEARLETCVAPGLPFELRRLRLRDLSGRARRIEVTTVAEVVLHHRAADLAHPVFSKLFVQTESVPALGALLARRRPRGNDERHPWLLQALLGPGEAGFETDRARWLGPSRQRRAPAAMVSQEPLSGSTGAVLDPILALRRTVALEPGGQAELVFVLGADWERETTLAMLEGLRVPGAVDQAFAGATRAARDGARRAGLEPAAAECWNGVLAAMLYGHPGLRAPVEVLERARPVPGLTARLGIPPAAPLVVAHPGPAGPGALLAAHQLWRGLGVPVETVLVEGDAAGAEAAGAIPGVHPVRRADLGEAALETLEALAHLVVRPGTDPWSRLEETPAPPGGAQAAAGRMSPAAAAEPAPESRASPWGEETLRHFNGIGGFADEGHEYVVRLRHRGPEGLSRPPLPWTNVLANEHFGALVGETGAGCTWSQNSREHRLTPWSNDPLLDPHDEALYLRDEADGTWWSPLPGPAPAPADYEMRHGFGYSRCRHSSHGLDQETVLFVARHDPVKVVRVRLANTGATARRLSLFAYQRLVLGGIAEESGRHIVTALAPGGHALLARNRFAGDFAERVAFAASAAPAARSVRCSADRGDFLGPGGPEAPRAVAEGGPLQTRTGAALDPCFAQQVELELPPGGAVECAFVLGEGADEADARTLVERFRRPGEVERSLAEVTAWWRELVCGVRVETPAPEIDLMVNGWLAYQDLACRIWGRTAFYQSGGAFGYRDQLQDAVALLALDPGLARRQILLHAAHQFVEGDVLHWWHPPRSRGIRTRFADDLLWLPYLATHYAQASGDWAVFDEGAPYLTGPPLEPGEDERFMEPADSGTSGDVYEHCCRAIDRSLVTGERGLPLFGTGDWNDGMNRVGREGRGESVWMGFFLYAILGDFLGVCERRGDTTRAARYRTHRQALQAALETAGWDGGWYRRAYYDDGTALGTRHGDECRIDALAQAWAVISGAAPEARARQAMEAVERELVSAADGLIRLLAPPFDRTPHDPGYIKGYVPGVRENGGQYTHAALWVVRAFAELGRRDLAAPLLAMLSPVSHGRTPAEVARYQAEPYVVAADVYGVAPHVGRGGWTWYTGSAGWMLRVALESVLGLREEGGHTLRLKPCVPDDWHGFTVHWRVPGTTTGYEMHVRNAASRAAGVVKATVDGEPVPVADGEARIPLARDGRPHRVEVELG
jgi:cyclic beta-1,2-glucan synthetase